MTTLLTDAPVLALTVRPPWSHWITWGIKRVENRTWAPPRGWRGQLVIHAGLTMDWDAFAVGAALGHPVDHENVCRGEFVAVANLVDVHRAGPACTANCTPWGEPGRYHWVLENTRRLVTTEGRGRQRLFVPPADVLEQVRELATDMEMGDVTA